MLPPIKPQNFEDGQLDRPVTIITAIVIFIIGLTFFFFVKSYFKVRAEIQGHPDRRRIMTYSVTTLSDYV